MAQRAKKLWMRATFLKSEHFEQTTTQFMLMKTKQLELTAFTFLLCYVYWVVPLLKGVENRKCWQSSTQIYQIYSTHPLVMIALFTKSIGESPISGERCKNLCWKWNVTGPSIHTSRNILKKNNCMLTECNRCMVKKRADQGSFLGLNTSQLQCQEHSANGGEVPGVSNKRKHH